MRFVSFFSFDRLSVQVFTVDSIDLSRKIKLVIAHEPNACNCIKILLGVVIALILDPDRDCQRIRTKVHSQVLQAEFVIGRKRVEFRLVVNPSKLNDGANRDYKNQ